MKISKLDKRDGAEGWGWVFVEVESEKGKVIECVWRELTIRTAFSRWWWVPEPPISSDDSWITPRKMYFNGERVTFWPKASYCAQYTAGSSLTEKVIFGDFVVLSSLNFLRYSCEKLCPPSASLAEAVPYFCQHRLLSWWIFLPWRPWARISSSENKHKTKPNLSEAVQRKRAVN